jgi:hypothetical protein
MSGVRAGDLAAAKTYVAEATGVSSRAIARFGFVFDHTPDQTVLRCLRLTREANERLAMVGALLSDYE